MFKLFLKACNAAGVISSCHIFRMGFSHLLSWLDLWWHHQSLQIYQKHKVVLFYFFQVSYIVLLHECAQYVILAVLSALFCELLVIENWTHIV